MQFINIPDGAHFSDGKRDFVKLITKLPSGFSVTYTRTSDEEPLTGIVFNAVDDVGCPVFVPEWVEFDVYE